MLGFCFICFLIGFLLGYVIQRGYFCMYNGFANMMLVKDYRIIKGSILAFLIALLGFNLLAHFNIITLAPKPFFYVGNILGSFLFSIGMVTSGSCIVGSPLRAASGRIAYWFTLLGMGIGGWLVIWGPLANFKTNVLQKPSQIIIAGQTPTLDLLFGLNKWLIIIVLSFIAIVALLKMKDSKKEEGHKNAFWGWIMLGSGLGILEILAFLTGKSPAGLGGFIKGYGIYFKAILEQNIDMGWPASEILGILVGVFVAAVIHKEFRIIWPKDFKQIVRLFTGGFLMGVGAVVAAGGCNVAHYLSHMPQLSVGSFVSGITIAVTTMTLIHFLFVRDLKK